MQKTFACGGPHDGHFWVPHCHHRWHCDAPVPSPADIPISGVRRNLAWLLSPRQMKLVALQRVKILFSFASVPLIELRAFVPYRLHRAILVISCFLLAFHLSLFCISFVHFWNRQTENRRTISLQLGKVRFSKESIKDVSSLLFWLPECFCSYI